jgi:hypothetical protein
MFAWHFQITLQSNATAFFVFLEAMGIPGKFSDNSFMMRAEKHYQVDFTSRYGPVDAATLADSLQVRSLSDTIFPGEEVHAAAAAAAAMKTDQAAKSVSKTSLRGYTSMGRMSARNV